MLFALWTGATVLLATSRTFGGGFGKDAAGSTLAVLGVLTIAGVLGALVYRALATRLSRPVLTTLLGVVAVALVPLFVWAMPTIVIVI